MSWIDRLKLPFGSKGTKIEHKITDTTSIHYSMPTVAADSITFVMPTQATFEGAPQFHEDDWCQIEFLPVDGLKEIQTTLAEYKVFEQAHRLQNGWTQIFARKLDRSPLIKGADAVRQLAGLFGTARINAPILTTASRPLGQVDGGFRHQTIV
jgi:hypothetical protein